MDSDDGSQCRTCDTPNHGHRITCPLNPAYVGDYIPPLPVTCQTGEPWVDEWPTERLLTPPLWVKWAVLMWAVGLAVMVGIAVLYV